MPRPVDLAVDVSYFVRYRMLLLMWAHGKRDCGTFDTLQASFNHGGGLVGGSAVTNSIMGTELRTLFAPAVGRVPRLGDVLLAAPPMLHGGPIPCPAQTTWSRDCAPSTRCVRFFVHLSGRQPHRAVSTPRLPPCFRQLLWHAGVTWFAPRPTARCTPTALVRRCARLSAHVATTIDTVC